MTAEYMAMSDATRQAVLMGNLVQGFEVKIDGASKLLSDSSSALVALAADPAHHDRSRLLLLGGGDKLLRQRSQMLRQTNRVIPSRWCIRRRSTASS